MPVRTQEQLLELQRMINQAQELASQAKWRDVDLSPLNLWAEDVGARFKLVRDSHSDGWLATFDNLDGWRDP